MKGTNLTIDDNWIVTQSTSKNDFTRELRPYSFKDKEELVRAIKIHCISTHRQFKICEDIPQVLDAENPGSSERPIDVFLPRLLQVLYMSMDSYLQGLFVLANDPSLEVRKLPKT
ncbi:unnamed protein product [Lactuca saligna]|uniref:Uncharacterized protein n=1 Tax=Lactuca saligna TaxID=75948 RepID=A0AA35YEE0_LACSI|nr:unnamed protein product [Lactuca saligna]